MKRNNVKRCRELRKNQTDAECKLWLILRNRQLLGVKFKRQSPIDKYILDFYSPEYKLGIEADGGQHYEPEGIRRDKIRDRELLRILEIAPSPQSSPQRGEEVIFHWKKIFRKFRKIWLFVQTSVIGKYIVANGHGIILFGMSYVKHHLSISFTLYF